MSRPAASSAAAVCTARVVGAETAFLDEARARLEGAGLVVLGTHPPDELVGLATLWFVELGSLRRHHAGGPVVVIGPRANARERSPSDAEVLLHLDAWPDAPDTLAELVRTLVPPALARHRARSERLHRRAMERLFDLETASIEIVDPSVRLAWVNDAFSRVTGYPREAVIGRTTGELFRAGTHDPVFYRGIVETLRAGRTWTGAMVGQRADGALSYQEAAIAPVSEGDELLGFVALKRDLDRDALAERALRGPNKRARALLAAVADPWFVHDAAGDIVELNPVAEDAFALREPTRRDAGLRALVHEDDWSALTTAWSTLEEGHPVTLEARVRLGDGTLANVSIRSGTVTLAGARLILSALRDETERVRLEDALRESTRAAEQAARARTRFVANMSHELRTPMSAVIGLADLALGQPDVPPIVRGYLEKLSHAATSLLGVIGDVLDFAKVDAEQLRLDETDFELDSVLSSVTLLVAQRAEQNGLELVVDVAPDVPRRLRGDPLRLQQVLTNLVTNAIKFTERGSVRVDVRREEAPGEDTVRLRFEVVDTGIGLSETERDRLFQPFAQADDSTTRRYGGTGLGLTISQRLVELMGGTITIESVKGRGSTFRFTAAFRHATTATSRAASSAAARISLAGVRVLVVEDVAINQLIATHTLEKLGATVSIASDGAKALEAMRRSTPATAFDVVLMDLQMPVLDGFEATKRLREDPRFHDVPIVAMTAHALDEERERCLSVGMDDHLGKPFDPAKLAATVATWARLGNERKAATKPAAPLEADRGIAQLGGNVDGYRRALGAFVAGASTTLAPLDEALEAADLDEARAELAALRGAASTLGASLLRRAIDELEGAIEADADTRRRARHTLATSLRATCEAAARWLAS